MKVLVTGATGYIGGRLIPLLLETGHQVRVLARDSDRLRARAWGGQVEVVEGAIEDVDKVSAAVCGMDAAYYLVHAMCSGEDFSSTDRRTAETFAKAAQGLKQVVYLGGILPGGNAREHSDHLRSRAEVGEILRSELPTTELRAGPIIGSGSASFEMVRYLTERLPVMVAPHWIKNQVQPIAVRDILAYLVAVLGREDAQGVIDVGTDPLTFKQMMLEYAKVRGLPRVILPVPVLAPGLAARWVGLVTPIPNCLAVPLVRGIVAPVVADTRRAQELFPEIRPIPYRTAVELAVEKIRVREVPTRWSDALGKELPSRLEDKEGMFREIRTRLVDAPPEAVFKAFSSLGGDRGWLVWNWAWRIRGWMDKVVGGPGLRRGRRDPSNLMEGDAVDFWRVETIDPPHLLRLRAEMKLPGRGWLEWEARGEDGQTLLTQVAIFAPVGFLGWAYWHASYPFHARIFRGMVDGIARLAVEEGVG